MSQLCVSGVGVLMFISVCISWVRRREVHGLVFSRGIRFLGVSMAQVLKVRARLLINVDCLR